MQVPTTYRAGPLAGADGALIGTLEHSVLGTRWVYDGCHDPVYVEALATAIATGGTQADLQVQSPDGEMAIREATTRVQGSGTDTAVPIDVGADGVVRSGDDDDPVRSARADRASGRSTAQVPSCGPVDADRNLARSGSAGCARPAAQRRLNPALW